ncbi:ATP-dependent DNA/RNA helicase DHX36 [Rhincodon typus]|uniref:ATP-dependent DNA/RNA helicase DHX36 n=1 Tax=Rhincodon typus TaxID=259920 RepID=UPI00202E072A|nr:ATP-dependent DNA/RNA helicase DHX36 [Rhincodon typus]
MSSGYRRDWRGGSGGGGSSSAGWENSAGGRGRGRHPAHLKGKDIGLWYAKRQGQKSKEQERSERAVVQMDEAREEHITRLLNSVQTRSDYKDQRASLSADSSKNWRSACPSSSTNKETKPETSADLEYLFETITQDVFLDEELKEELMKKTSSLRYLDMKRFREKLPSYGMKKEVVDLINENQVLVISGETGCGKTTQVTQFILDDYIERGKGSLCRVVCTQPRRISAISIAERVAAERAEACGDGNSTGYQIRLQSRLPRKQGSILYCTTGIILQWLQSDSLLSTVSHLVLDEVHERSLQSDVLMTIVKDILPFRPDLKVILMSATLNANKFSEYFDSCPMLHIPGFTYPVKEYILEDVIELLQYRPQTQEIRRPSSKRRFMQGCMFRPEKERVEEEYQQQWPEYMRELQGRYSDSTIEALEILHDDDKIDLNLIVALIKHIVLHGELLLCVGSSHGSYEVLKMLENCLQNNLLLIVSLQMLHNMKGQFAEHLLVAGFVSSKNPRDPKANINSDNEKLIKAVVCAGLYPKVAKIRPSFSKKRKMAKVFTKSDGRVNIHPKSVNAEEGEFEHNWLIYHLKMRTTSIYLYDCTEVSPYSLLFFGGDISIQKEQSQETISVDEWIVFQSPSRIAHLVKDLKRELDALLQDKIKKPQPVDWNNRSKDCAVLSAIIDLITTQDNANAKNYTPRFQSC